MSTPKPSAIEKQINRTCWIAYINGGSIAGFAALCLLISLFFGPDWIGVVVCLFITIAGLMEVKGGRMLRARKATSRSLLTGSQLLFFITITAYCTYQILYHDIAASLAALPPEALDLLAELYQLHPDDLIDVLQIVFKITYGIIIFVSFLYQGGLMLYYALKSKKILND